MKPTITFQVKPRLPKKLEPLAELSRNLWFCWHREAVELFQRLDPNLWNAMGRNPVAVLNRVPQKRLEALGADGGFLAEMERVYSQFKAYVQADTCPYLKGRDDGTLKVAYFSAEFGLADCLPIYSGGLGILSGDHLKSASNLNLPLVGIGLAYGQGYFNQYLNPDGYQQEKYLPNDFWNLPMELVKNGDGSPLSITVDIEGRPLKAQAWKVQVGRVPLYLMDANLEENPADLRQITWQLYGGDKEMRIRQEILLGIGGVRLLKALGIEYNALHMNEGHSAFAALECIRQYREDHGLTFDQAKELVKAQNCFTTHTPVPAGNDYFEPELVIRHFQGYMSGLGISLPVLLGYGRIKPTNQEELFCMTVLALRLSSFSNGVSRLHGEVSREMWHEVWPHFPVEDAPIDHITNGVHIPSWISQDMAELYERYLGVDWMEDPDSALVWARAESIPDAELWRVHQRRRARLITFVRKRLVEQLRRRGSGAEKVTQAEEILSPDVLTIVFARRFATYKRAVMILRDKDRLNRILNHPDRPAQIIFAGKAHPKDEMGKEFIRRVANLARDPRFRHRMVFVEDYDINVARYLVQGADVWLNTPRWPMEACGTSGMKATANGGLNLSIPDGWWAEGYEPGLGWSIGAGERYADEETQDRIEAQELYQILEEEVAPLFYTRFEHNLPRNWISYMKKNLARLCPVYNTHRQLENYADKAYLPASIRCRSLAGNDFQGARELAEWTRRIMEHWSEVSVLEVGTDAPECLRYDDETPITARVRLGQLTPGDVACEIYMGRLDAEGEFMERETVPMEPATEQSSGEVVFKGNIKASRTGRLGVKVRVVPNHELLAGRHDLGLAVWG